MTLHHTCNTCGSRFDQYEVEWVDDNWTGLRLRCPSCGDLLRRYDLEESPVEEPLPVS